MIKGKIGTKFPATVTAESPIDLVNDGGNYTVSLDLDEVEVLLTTIIDTHAAHPALTTDNAIARYSGTSGGLQSSGVIISDANVISATGLTLIPSTSGFRNGFGQQQIISSLLGSTEYFINYQITTDTADASANVLNGVYGAYYAYSVGGSTVKGSRSALTASCSLTAPTNAANTNRFYLGGFITAQAATGDGGTNTGAGALGYIGGLNVGVSTTAAAATNLELLIGLEVDVNMTTGSTTKGRVGVGIGANGLGQGQGAETDCALLFSNNVGTDGWKDVMFLTSVVSAPVATNGNIIRAAGGFSISSVIDVSAITVTDYVVRGSTFLVYASTGNVRAAANTAIPAGGVAGRGYSFSSTTNFGVFFGSSTPTLSAAKGSLYLCSNGVGTNSRVFVNTDGSTAWTALITAT